MKTWLKLILTNRGSHFWIISSPKLGWFLPRDIKNEYQSQCLSLVQLLCLPVKKFIGNPSQFRDNPICLHSMHRQILQGVSWAWHCNSCWDLSNNIILQETGVAFLLHLFVEEGKSCWAKLGNNMLLGNAKEYQNIHCLVKSYRSIIWIT